MYQRSFEELRGISASMSQQMSRVLADGLSHGESATKLARRLSDTVQGITRQRANVLARTELINAHAEGQLDSFEELGVQAVGAEVEITTAGDDRVCPLCSELSGAQFTVQEARGLIPRHPNCRCSWRAAIDKNGNLTQWSKAQKRDAVNRSLKAELPKRTRTGEKVPQTVAEAKRRSTWVGKTKTFSGTALKRKGDKK
jgi:SPP1 gp7 family putative phage head morphogenesis protein